MGLTIPETATCVNGGPQRISIKEEEKNDPSSPCTSEESNPYCWQRDIPAASQLSSNCPGFLDLSVSIKQQSIQLAYVMF